MDCDVAPVFKTQHSAATAHSNSTLSSSATNSNISSIGSMGSIVTVGNDPANNRIKACLAAYLLWISPLISSMVGEHTKPSAVDAVNADADAAAALKSKHLLRCSLFVSFYSQWNV